MIKKRVFILVGTRPNFIKVTRFKEVAKNYPGLEIKIIHTGQHYDHKMADVFFDQFGLRPDYFLETPVGKPNSQIAEIMLRLESLFNEIGLPDVLLVPGDVNSTLAGAITAQKMGIKLGHIESGLRSFDREMPEEVNRIITDQLSDFYFVTEKSGLANIANEKLPGQAWLVGNTMIDTLVVYDKQIVASTIVPDLNIKGDFVLMTIHRPSNVDSKEGLLKLIDLLKYLDKTLAVVFPVHPRTVTRLKHFGLYDDIKNIKNLVTTEPLGYFEFQKLIRECRFVLTDSGGIQEETTFRQKPCLTLRNNTERPITTEIGTNTLVTFDVGILKQYINDILKDNYKIGQIPKLWDGKATERIVEILTEL